MLGIFRIGIYLGFYCGYTTLYEKVSFMELAKLELKLLSLILVAVILASPMLSSTSKSLKTEKTLLMFFLYFLK
jgi:hypothetical protein